MLMSSFFKRTRKEGDPKGPAIQFTAATHAVNNEVATRDKAAMEAEVEAACAHTVPQSPLRTESSS